MTRYDNFARARRTRRDRQDWALYVLFALFVVLAFGGGGARADIQSLVYVRPAAVIALGLLGATFGMRAFAQAGDVLRFALALALLMAMQLVPLPPSYWGSFPGREMFAGTAEIAGVPEPWRPLTLVPDATLNSLYAMFVPVATAVAAANMPSRRWQQVVWCLFVIAMLSALLGMLQVAAGVNSGLYLYEVTNRGSGVGLFSNRNHQAFFVCMSIPLLFYLYLAYRPQLKLYQVALLGVAFVFLLVSIWATGSRAGLSLSLLALLSSIAFMLPPEMRRLRMVGVAVGATVLLAAGAMVVIGTSQMRVFDRLATLSKEDELRFVLFGDFFNLARNYFTFGAGFGTFEHIYRVFERPETLSERYVNHAHMDWLEFAIEGGLPALIILAAFAVWWLRTAFRVFACGNLRPRAFVLVSAIAMAASVADYPLRTPLLAAVFAISLVAMQGGQQESARVQPNGPHEVRRRRGKLES